MDMERINQTLSEMNTEQLQNALRERDLPLKANESDDDMRKRLSDYAEQKLKQEAQNESEDSGDNGTRADADRSKQHPGV